MCTYFMACMSVKTEVFQEQNWHSGHVPALFMSSQKFGVGTFNKKLYISLFIMILKEVSYAHQDCTYLTKNTVKTVILWNIITF